MVQQARAFTTRALIVQGAARAFERFGYDGASLNEVVEAAGTTKGALYFHFKTKEALAQEVVAAQHRQSTAAVEAIGRTEAPALEQIVMLCQEMARQIREEPLVRAGIRVTLELSVTDGPDRPYEDWIAATSALVRAAIDQGDLRDEIDADALGRFIVSAFTGVHMLSQVLERRADLEMRVDEMLRIVIPGLMAPRRRARFDTMRAARWNPDSGTRVTA